MRREFLVVAALCAGWGLGSALTAVNDTRVIDPGWPSVVVVRVRVADSLCDRAIESRAVQRRWSRGTCRFDGELTVWLERDDGTATARTTTYRRRICESGEEVIELALAGVSPGTYRPHVRFSLALTIGPPVRVGGLGAPGVVDVEARAGRDRLEGWIVERLRPPGGPARPGEAEKQKPGARWFADAWEVCAFTFDARGSHRCVAPDARGRFAFDGISMAAGYLYVRGVVGRWRDGEPSETVGADVRLRDTDREVDLVVGEPAFVHRLVCDDEPTDHEPPSVRVRAHIAASLCTRARQSRAVVRRWDPGGCHGSDDELEVWLERRDDAGWAQATRARSRAIDCESEPEVVFEELPAGEYRPRARFSGVSAVGPVVVVDRGDHEYADVALEPGRDRLEGRLAVDPAATWSADAWKVCFYPPDSLASFRCVEPDRGGRFSFEAIELAPGRVFAHGVTRRSGSEIDELVWGRADVRDSRSLEVKILDPISVLHSNCLE